MGVPTEMAAFYETFRIYDEGTLPTMMPVGSLEMAFRFLQDLTEAVLRQNAGNTIKDADQMKIGEVPVGMVGYPDDTYNYDTITRRSRRRRR